MPKLKLPYTQDAGYCYDRLARGLPLYQKGIGDIRFAMESNNSFEQRLRKVLRLHAMNLQAAETEEPSDSWNEDVYLCCLYDMLESMYNAESERIAVAAGGYQEKLKNLEDLKASIARLPFGSAENWNNIRHRLERAVFKRIQNLEGRL